MPAVLNYAKKLPRPDDPAIYEPICNAIAIGHPQTTAASLAGIHEDTLYHWRYKGEEELRALGGEWKPWEELGVHAQFVFRIKAAQAGFADEALHRWRDGEKNWQAWCTLLERRMPDDFGRNQRPPEAPPGEFAISMTGSLTQDQIASMLQALADHAGQERTLPALTDGPPHRGAEPRHTSLLIEGDRGSSVDDAE